MMKKVAIAALIFLLLIAGLVVVISLIPLDSYRGVIEDKASSALGRKVALKGPLGVTLFPKPGVSIDQLEVANVPGAKDPLFASVRKVKAFVSIWPLLSKRFEVTSLSVDQPRIFLEQIDAEKNNWTFDIPKSEGKSEFQVLMHELSIFDAQVSYRKAETVEIVTINSADIEMTTLSGPFDIEAEIVAQKLPIEITAKVGALDSKIPIELKVRSDKTTLKSSITWDRAVNRLLGHLDAEVDPAIISQVKAGITLPKMFESPFKLKTDLDASADSVKLTQMILELKGQSISGTADLSLKPTLQAKVSLNGLPGQSDCNLMASSESGKWGGTLTVNIKSLTPLLKWLDMSTDSIPEKLTKDIVFKTNFDVDGQSRLRDLRLIVGPARLSGDINYESKNGSQKVTFSLSTPNADALLAVAEKELANPVGEASIAGTVSGSQKHMSFSLRPNFAASEMSFEGDAYDLKDKPRFDSNLNIRTSRLSTLAKLTGVKAPSKIESATIIGKVKGSLEAIEIDLKTQFETLTLNAKGTVSDLKKATSVDLAVDANDPDFRNLMHTLELPASVPKGKMNAFLRLKGPLKNLQATGLKLSVGPNFSAAGDFALNREQAKSFVKAQVTAGALDITDEAPTERASQADSSWSTNPIDFSFLNSMNADVEFRAASLKRKDIVVQNPKVSLKVSDGKMVAPLSGTIFGGGFNMIATVTANGAATIRADLKDAKVQSLIAKQSDLKMVDGRLGVDVDLGMQGKSMRELISSLRGKVGFASKDGKINGFDLQAISRQISNFKDWTSVLGLLTTSLNGGQTKYNAFNGQLLFDRGVGSFQGVTLTADTAQADAKGSIDLVSDSMNVKVDVKLTQPANLPSIGMRLEGPIASPRRVLDTTALQSYLVHNVFSNVLENVRSGRVNDVKDPVDLLNKVFGRPTAPVPGTSNRQPSNKPSQGTKPWTLPHR